MPWLAADPVIVLPAHREVLEALVRAHSTSQQLALRARMILHAADNIGVRESARELDVWPKTVRYWRGRAHRSFLDAALAAILTDKTPVFAIDYASRSAGGSGRFYASPTPCRSIRSSRSWSARSSAR